MGLRREQVLALEAAVVDLKKTKAEGRKPRADHLHFAKSFDHSKLVEQYAPYIKGVYRASHHIILPSIFALIAHRRFGTGAVLMARNFLP